MKITSDTKSKFPPGAILWHNKQQTFTKLLNFTTMKKLILILFMALFALGVSTTYGQLNPRAVTCLTADALHPIAGNPYDYTIDVPTPTPGTAWTTLQYNWFVTQDPAFMANGALTSNISPDGGPLFDRTGGSAYNVAYPGQPTSPTIELTWKSFAYNPAQPVFVGILVTGVNGVPCTINNIKIYQILPQHAFTLDIDNLTDAGVNHTPGDSITGANYGDNLDVCISNIVSATFDAANLEVDYDFGADTLYYEVVAANWYDRWQLSVQITGVARDSNQTAKIDWAYAPVTRPIGNYNALSWTLVVTSADNSTPYTCPDLIAPQNGTGAVGPAGESIIVRVILDHGNQFDGIYDLPINLAVNGVLAVNDGSGNYVPGNPLIVGDIHFTTGGTPPACPWFDMFANDISLQTLKARPNINAVTPTPFLPIGN